MTTVGKNVSKSRVPDAWSVAYGHWPDENHVSKVSGSRVSSLLAQRGHFVTSSSMSTMISPHPQYFTGMGMPHQIWREIGQSRRFFIQCMKIFSCHSGRMAIVFDSTAATAMSRRDGLPSGSGFVIATYHCGIMSGSITVPHL